MCEVVSKGQKSGKDSCTERDRDRKRRNRETFTEVSEVQKGEKEKELARMTDPFAKK